MVFGTIFLITIPFLFIKESLERVIGDFAGGAIFLYINRVPPVAGIEITIAIIGVQTVQKIPGKAIVIIPINISMVPGIAIKNPGSEISMISKITPIIAIVKPIVNGCIMHIRYFIFKNIDLHLHIFFDESFKYRYAFLCIMMRARKIVGIVLCTILLVPILTTIVQGNEKWNVTLVGNETKVYNLTEIKAMPSYENGGAFIRTTGAVVGPHNYTGVNMTYLMDLAGGINSSQSLKVSASDGYSITFTYDQVMGNITTYNEKGEPIGWSEPITMMLAYAEDGDLLETIYGGPLRITYVGDECDGQYPITDGHFWIKWVTEIGIQSMVEEWNLTLTGAITEVMDRATFESGANCHGISWTDDENRTWSGIPLWLLVGRVDDEIMHGAGAFNDELCEKGYNVTVISSDNYTITFNSTFVCRNDDFIVANKLNGTQLNVSEYGYLRLVGPALEGHHKLKRVTEIRLTNLQE